MRIVEVGEQRVGTNAVTWRPSEQSQEQIVPKPGHAIYSGFPFFGSLMAGFRPFAGSMITGLPTVARSLAGLSSLIARCTDLAALALRLSACDRVEFGITCLRRIYAKRKRPIGSWVPLNDDGPRSGAWLPLKLDRTIARVPARRRTLIAIPPAVDHQHATHTAPQNQRGAQAGGPDADNDRQPSGPRPFPNPIIVRGVCYSIGAGMRAADINGRATWFNSWSAFSSSASDSCSNWTSAGILSCCARLRAVV